MSKKKWNIKGKIHSRVLWITLRAMALVRKVGFYKGEFKKEETKEYHPLVLQYLPLKAQ